MRQSVESVINESKYFEKVLNKILYSTDQQPNASRLVSVIRTQTININRNVNTRENLKKKLRFKLARIIICLRKLTNASSKSFLNEASQLKLLTDTILNHMKENNELKSNELEDDDIDTEVAQMVRANVDYEEFNEFNFLDASEEEEEEVEDNDDDDKEQFGLDESDELYNDDPFVNVSVDIKEFKRFYVFNYVLEEFGNSLDDRVLAEYSEDIVKSLECELEDHVDDLRRDFVNIDKYVKELRVAIGKEWLNKYEEKVFQNKYGQKLLNLNYLEENDEK
jgi:hypothetical protein